MYIDSLKYDKGHCLMFPVAARHRKQGYFGFCSVDSGTEVFESSNHLV